MQTRIGSASTQRVAALLAAAAMCSCGAGGADYDAPSIIALSAETPIPEKAELVGQCLPSVQRLADNLHYKLGPLHFTHSDKWGDVVRVDLTSQDTDITTRIACVKNKIAVGVLPAGTEELVPAQLQGVWAMEAKCSVRTAQLVLTAATVQFGMQQPYEIRYFPNGDGGQGEFVTTDGTWLAPQYEPTKDLMIWSDKSGRTTYQRCPKRQ